MKTYISVIAIVIIWCAVMPTVICTGDGQAYAEKGEYTSVSSEESAAPVYITVCDGTTNERCEYSLEEYTALALSAVMDGNTPPEALKAQAVAIRSVVCYRLENGDELCTDGEHCFALADEADKRCTEAVAATRGLLLTYNGCAAFAVSHSSSHIRTESGTLIYGKEFLYLPSVEVLDESAFPIYTTKKVLSVEEYKSAFSNYSVSFTEDNLVGNTTFTESKRVWTMEAGGLCFKGSTVARLFDLPSTCFEIEISGGTVTFTCRGSGNGVGMSRSSAALMAEDGKTYTEILEYFYPETRISRLRTE